jgi:hypothetical protein
MTARAEDAAPDAHDSVWAWFAARRRGTRYQPPASDPEAPPEAGAPPDDPNGCVPKLAALRASAYPFVGARLLSLGCNAGYYEAELLRGGADARHGRVHLVDNDPEALADAERVVRARGVRRVRAWCGPAERAPLDDAYDAALFLSLYHHYDRLGGAARETGRRLLAAVGRRAQTLLFETGQSDDRVHGAERWTGRLEMSGASTPERWLTEVVPELAGYDAWRPLGRNPRTNRLLYAYWRERRPVPAAFAEPGAAYRVGVRVRDGAVVARAPGASGWAPADAALGPGGRRPVLLDCAAAPATALDLRRVVRWAAGLPRDRFALVVADARALRHVPHDVAAAVRPPTAAEERRRALAAARYAGARAVVLPAGGPGAAEARGLGLDVLPDA